MTREAFSQTIADRIRERRDALHMTQYALALAIGVKRSTVCAWESGSRTVSAYHYSRLETFFSKRESVAGAKP